MSQVTRRSRVRVLPTHAPGSSLLPFARLGFATRANYIYFFSSLQNRVMTRSDLWFDVLLSFLLVSRIAFFFKPEPSPTKYSPACAAPTRAKVPPLHPLSMRFLFECRGKTLNF